MFKIDNASAAPALPAPADAGTPGFFTDGDPVGGTPATVLPADFMNMIMLELVNLVIAGGLTPSKVDYTQVRDAIAAYVGAAGAPESGYFEIPAPALGLTIIVNMGGGAHADGSGHQAVNFAQPFQVGAFYVDAGNNASGPPAAFHGCGVPTKTGMTVYSAQSAGVAAGAGTAFRYIAIGV